jgi:hypothetical protein
MSGSKIMKTESYEFMVDNLTKFQKYLYIFGWFYHPSDELVSIEVKSLQVVAYEVKVQIEHGGVVNSFGPNRGFEVSILRPENKAIPDDATIVFVTRDGMRLETSLRALAQDRNSRVPGYELSSRFLESCKSDGEIKALDIGGRARSKRDRRSLFHGAEVTVLDILGGENVDVVGDAHKLSSYFPQATFDRVYSASVFEHLIMPWKVVIEMNKVMKLGGIGFVATHQTIGLHDMPWDYWRFSNTSWEALFNEKTGFRIIDRAMDLEQFVLPFIYRPGKWDAERSAGFENSSVMFEKISECNLEWPIEISDLTDTSYPDDDDHQSIDPYVT